MSNIMAITLGGIILAALIADQALNAGNATLFLGQKLFLLVEYLNFWS